MLAPNGTIFRKSQRIWQDDDSKQWFAIYIAFEANHSGRAWKGNPRGGKVNPKFDNLHTKKRTEAQRLANESPEYAIGFRETREIEGEIVTYIQLCDPTDEEMIDFHENGIGIADTTPESSTDAPF